MNPHFKSLGEVASILFQRFFDYLSAPLQFNCLCAGLLGASEDSALLP